MPTQEGEKRGLIARTGRYYRDLRGELKKVVWPTRKQVVNNTLIVMGFVVVAAIAVSALDGALAWMVSMLIKSV